MQNWSVKKCVEEQIYVKIFSFIIPFMIFYKLWQNLHNVGAIIFMRETKRYFFCLEVAFAFC